MPTSRNQHRISAYVIVLIGLLAVLLIAGAIASWQIWGTTKISERRTDEALQQFAQSCRGGTSVDGLIGILDIDAIDVHTPIWRGTDTKSLASGVGWYPSTQEPGQAGNFALAGYRITNGAPLKRLLELNRDDIVTVRNCESQYRYAIEVAPRELTVHPQDSWVLAAVPGHPGQFPSESILTITADQDLIPTPDRSVLMARLVTS